MNTQIIAIANQKGGVGKTTTCANLGIGLAQAGKKVLLIDGDPQGSLTISLGNPQPDKLPFTLSDAMGKILMDQPIRPGEGILHHAEGVDLMPADIQLSGMEVSLVNAMSRETILRQYLDTLKGQYSHILIDCQPSLGMLTVNALAAANRIIIPVQAEYLPAKGLEQLLSTVNKVKRQINPKLQIDGILLTMVDNRTNFAKESIEAAVREHFDGMYLSHDAAKGVIETYGMERVSMVLSNTIQLQGWDGRYSRRNKEWAKTIPNENPETVRCGYALNSHPAVLDGFIDLVREEQQRSRTQREKLEPSRPSVRDKLKQELPAHKSATPKKREPER